MILPGCATDLIPRRTRHALPLVVIAALGIGTLRGGQSVTHPDVSASAAGWQQLIDQLGDPDYATREIASEKLAAAGAAAADALLAAAEETADLEVALRAAWLVAEIPLGTGHESPEAAGLLDDYIAGDPEERFRVMRQLLRLDDDAGIEPLARIVRLERSATGSRLAAAILVQDWEPRDPYWPRVVPGILAGLGDSSRPAARFLRGLATAATADSPDEATGGVADCQAALERLAAPQDPAEAATAPAQDDLSTPADRASRVFRRCLVALLADQGLTSAALAAATPLFASSDRAGNAEQAAVELNWLTSHGFPEAVDLVSEQLKTEPDPFLAYAAALAWQARPDEDAAGKATDLATLAHRLLEGSELTERLAAAMLLARWGGIEWADAEYRSVLAAAETRPAERALAAISYAEFLHDQDRSADAAEALRSVLEAEGQAAEDFEQGLMQLGREPRAIRSRMLYFAASAAEEPTTRRQLIAESLQAYPDDIDSLIAAYRLADREPDRRAELVSRIAQTAATLERDIRSLAADSGSRNEYAWLIANTEGNVAKATRYSRESLRESFDTASYLDTLAHCHAAAGNLDRAIRTQWLAVKQEPHSLLIRRNFDRFRSLAGVRP